jgi:NADH-quinone oxidoreductase subunit J
MDYALLAATALGAIGLYLMLPRERAPLVRLGGLLGAMALAGFFLFLLRLGSTAVAGAGSAGSGPPVYFYLFAAIMIAGAIGVVCQPRPVYAALYFVLVTLAGAGIFVLLLAEFMAIVLIIIYAGAILVTYVFVIMLASQGSTGGAVVAPAYDRRASSGFASVVVSFVLVGAVLQALLPTEGRTLAGASPTPDPYMVRSLDMDLASTIQKPEQTVATTSPAVLTVAAPGIDGGATVPVLATAETTTQPAPLYNGPSNVQLLGISLYSRYSLSLELAGILLTIALIGAVVIARKNTEADQPLGTGKLPTE